MKKYKYLKLTLCIMIALIYLQPLIHKLVIVLRKKYFITVLLYFNKSV